MRSPFPFAVLFLAAVFLVIPVNSSALSASQVTLNFMCPCGTCDEALSTCECPQSDGFRSQIAGMVGRGYSEDQVIQDFKGRFGPSVLIVNAAMAPDSGGWNIDNKTIGLILLVTSFTLAAFGLGRYMSSAPSPAPAKRRVKQRPKVYSKPSEQAEKRGSKSGTRFRDGVDDELLDDYDHE